MYRLIKNNLSDFKYETEEGNVAQVFIDENLNAKIVFRFSHVSVKTVIEGNDIKSPYWYFSNCCTEAGNIMIAYQQDIILFLDRWVKLLLLLNAMDSARAENTAYLRALCETLHIPFDERHPKYSEDLCLRVIMKELAGYEEFEILATEDKKETAVCR